MTLLTMPHGHPQKKKQKDAPTDPQSRPINSARLRISDSFVCVGAIAGINAFVGV
jgi:hypothetical protein